MWKAVVVVVTAVSTFAALRRGWGLWLRRRAIRRLPPEQVVLQARGVPVRAFVQGAPGFRQLDPARANRVRADLAATSERFVLATERGVLADVRAGTGPGFTSVRSTGPGRLVIEGARPAPDGADGLYRFELVVDDTDRWVATLAPFVEPR